MTLGGGVAVAEATATTTASATTAVAAAEAAATLRATATTATAAPAATPPATAPAPAIAATTAAVIGCRGKVSTKVALDHAQHILTAADTCLPRLRPRTLHALGAAVHGALADRAGRQRPAGDRDLAPCRVPRTCNSPVAALRIPQEGRRPTW